MGKGRPPFKVQIEVFAIQLNIVIIDLLLGKAKVCEDLVKLEFLGLPESLKYFREHILAEDRSIAQAQPARSFYCFDHLGFPVKSLPGKGRRYAALAGEPALIRDDEDGNNVPQERHVLGKGNIFGIKGQGNIRPFAAQISAALYGGGAAIE